MEGVSGDGWTGGITYESFMGRWSRPLAREFVGWIDAPKGGHWLDVGTGTGALVRAIREVAEPASIVACDRSSSFVGFAGEEEAGGSTSFVVAEVGSLPHREGGYDAVASSLVLNFLPNPREAVKEQLGLVRKGGVVAACVWDYAEGMEFLRTFWDVAGQVSGAALEMDEGRRFPICDPDALETLFRSAGAAGLRGGSVSVPTVFRGWEDYWAPFLQGTGPAPSFVASLDEEERGRLESELRRRLDAEQGEVSLSAKAWVQLGYRA